MAGAPKSYGNWESSLVVRRNTAISLLFPKPESGGWKSDGLEVGQTGQLVGTRELDIISIPGDGEQQVDSSHLGDSNDRKWELITDEGAMKGI